MKFKFQIICNLFRCRAKQNADEFLKVSGTDKICSVFIYFSFSQSVCLDTDMTNDSFARLKRGSALNCLFSFVATK